MDAIALLDVAYNLGFHSHNFIRWGSKLFPARFRRHMTCFMMERFNYPTVGVEIGVAEGMNAHNMLHSLGMKHIYLVDPYVGTEDQMERMMHRLRKDRHRYTFIRGFSEDVADEIPDNLDFVYIDGEHTYEAAKRDIENYWGKVRPGGIMGGHDYNGDYPFVAKAVLEFVGREDLQLFGKGIDWWVVKR